MTTTHTREPVHIRFEQVLGVTVKVEITDDADDAHRYRATVEGNEQPATGLHIGAVIGHGKTPARARRRAVDRIANRRRGPSRSKYVIDGVMFGCFPNPDDQAPASHAYLAQVISIEAYSPMVGMLAVGQILAQQRNLANVADRAYYLVGQLAERARLAQRQHQQQPAVEQTTSTGDKAMPARWDDGALCQQVNPDLFFPDSDHPGTQTAATSLCERCPVQVECLARSLDQREPYGVWGGATEAMRRDLLRAGLNGNEVRARGLAVFARIRKSKAEPQSPAA